MTCAYTTRALAGALLLLAVLSAPARAQNQPGLIMQIEMERGGAFPAESTRTGQGIPLRSWNYSAAIPVDQGGTATGPRRYTPVSFEKAIGAASPHILKAMLSGDSLTITIDLTGISPQGTPVLLHRAVFQQARILSVTRNSTAPTGERVSSAASAAEMTETITFAFRRVEFDPGRPGGGYIIDELDVN